MVGIEDSLDQAEDAQKVKVGKPDAADGEAAGRQR